MMWNHKQLTELQTWKLAETVYKNTHKMKKKYVLSIQTGKYTKVEYNRVMSKVGGYRSFWSTIDGICSLISVLNNYNVISNDVYYAMKIKIGQELDKNKSSYGEYLYDLGLKGHKRRAAFCRRQIKLLSK